MQITIKSSEIRDEGIIQLMKSFFFFVQRIALMIEILSRECLNRFVMQTKRIFFTTLNNLINRSVHT